MAEALLMTEIPAQTECRIWRRHGVSDWVLSAVTPDG